MKRALACILPWSLAAFMPQAVSGAVIVIATNATITTANLELQGRDIIISNSLVSIDGTHSFSSLQVLAGSEITHGTGGIGLNVTVTSDIVIAAGTRIRADGKGGVGMQGPGAGYSSGSPTSGSGGGHGGRGGANGALVPGGAAYGSYVAPSTPGSAGGAGTGGLGGAGGGVVRLQAGGTLRIDGTITANGAAGMSSRSGGGSGGSIYLRAAEITGVGSVSADGGDGEPGAGGGGGGGRISMQSMANDFAGQISVQGGSGFAAGGAGTLFISRPNSVEGELVFDNRGRQGETPVGPLQAGLDVKIRGGAVVTPQTSMHLRNLTIVSGSIRVTNHSQAINTTGHVVMEREGRIEADRVNVGSGAGTGGMSFGVFSTGGGGGHGGYGGAGTNAVPYGGGVHGSSQKPVALGGRGGGMANTWGAGGGAIRMTIQGTLLCNGVISAQGGNSADGAGGGGAGGSIWITAGTIAGTGALVANGGRGNRPGAEMGGGGGGGGRIAIQVNTNLFKGSLSARGGDGGVAGGAGTIFTTLTRLPGAVLVDNGGLQGTNTVITEPTGFGLTVQNGGVVSIGQQTLSYLILRSNGWLSASSGVRPTPATRVTLRVIGHALIEEGSGIRVDGAGYHDASGPGRGWEAPGSPRNGGGSHGGYGGAATSPAMTRLSQVYGSITSPADPGSGGAPSRTGGAGGGSIDLNVAGSLNLSGTISANGLRGTTIGAGGGAGGSINMNVGALVGAGSISANGADGVGLGGGGGGGRIALRYGTNVFYGQVTAHGGRGEFPGGPGTIYARSSGGPGLVLIENGNQNGPTALSELNSIFDLHVANGARVWVSNSVMNLNNLTIGPASALHFPTLPTNVVLKVAGFAEVQEGGLLSANGAGYPAGAGPGAGVSSNGIGSGAGHGGRGGASSLSAGGIAYGSSLHPDLRGSGGGRGATQSPSIAGSSGGGALRLQIGRGLLLDGAIMANGESAQAENGGGGSGGSVWIETPMFFGRGSIEARGGDGEALQGGGGGGGRVLINAGFDSYLGALDVGGGRGYMAGETGTITFSDTVSGNTEPPALQVGSVSNESVVLTWPGTLGTTYRAFASTDLVVWEPSGRVITCTSANQVMQFTFPIEPGPCKFYRVATE